MKIPATAIIAEQKLTRYLLLARDYDDKSKFLSQAGFTARNPETLMMELRRLVARNEAVREGDSAYGEFYRVDGLLEGPQNRALGVSTIWIRLKTDGMYRFVTLKPLRR